MSVSCRSKLWKHPRSSRRRGSTNSWPRRTNARVSKPGTLAELAGIEARRWWPEGVTFDQAAAMAGRAALDAAGIDPSRVGMLISTSVCKHHLEPSVACAVHHQLQLAPSCLNFDVGNACLGFINGMQIAANAIDAGAIDYALIVDGEGSRYTQENTIARLQQPDDRGCRRVRRIRLAHARIRRCGRRARSARRASRGAPPRRWRRPLRPRSTTSSASATSIG